MINWKSKSEYYNVHTGLEISKRKVKLYYTIIRRYKIYNYDNCTRDEQGKLFGDGTITWINECEPNRQLSIFGRPKIRG